jgi:MFS family permease
VTAAAIGSNPSRPLPLVAVVAANVVSLTGSMLTTVAVPWFVLVTTGSALQTGITGAVIVLPIVIAGIFGGTLVDRLGFKETSVLSDLLSGSAIVLIPVLYHTVGLAFWELLLLLFLSKLLGGPGSTARRSLVPDLAGLAALPLERANAAVGVGANASNLLGPVLAGVLIALLGASNVLVVDAATFGVSALLIGAAIPSTRALRQPSRTRSSYFRELGVGLAYLRRDHLILVLALISAAANFVMVPLFAVVLPVYAKQVFGSAVALGVILGATGAGTLAGTLLYGLVALRLPRRGTYFTAFLVVGGVTMVLVTLPGVLVVAAILAVAGLAAAPLNPLLQTFVQERVAPGLLGRVFGLVGAISSVAAPLGLLVVGVLLEVAGLRITLIGVNGLLLVIALGLVALPSLRDLG